MRRREFLKELARATAVAGATLALPRSARAAGWGEYPANQKAALLPAGKRAKNVLEVFLYGGLSPWETFYVVPEYGHPKDPDHPNQQWWTFQEGKENVKEVYELCHGSAAPPMLQDFRLDQTGAQVRLGPFSEPLRSRADVVARLRLHINTHTLEPHEGAIPLAMSGFRLGHPKLAGVGAAVQHYFQSHATSAASEPYAYVLYSPGDFPTDNLRAASAVGQHPGVSRPLAIRVEASTAFVDALARATVGKDRAAFDAVVERHVAAYRRRLQWPGQTAPSRSTTYSDFRFSMDTLHGADGLAGILEPQFFSGQSTELCGDTGNPNYPRMGLRLAAHLLRRPGSLAKYVCVVDGGLIPASGGGGYDTHNRHVHDSARNLKNLWTELSSIINEPGEGDPQKLDLNETLVVINTEFGRTPAEQNGDGRNHHPYAYTTLMFGGPVGLDQQGIVGAIGADGLAIAPLSPAETRCAILAALGIHPFAPECYAVSDVSGAATELEASLLINERVLGVKA